MSENTELMARLIANDMVDLCDHMTNLLHGMVEMTRKAHNITDYPSTLPPLASLRMGCLAQAIGLCALGDWLQLIGVNHGAKYYSRGQEVLTTLAALQEVSGYDLGVELIEVKPL